MIDGSQISGDTWINLATAAAIVGCAIKVTRTVTLQARDVEDIRKALSGVMTKEKFRLWVAEARAEQIKLPKFEDDDDA